jgi:hypothetical protein
MAGAYGLRLADVIANPPFFWGVLVVFVLASEGAALMARRAADPGTGEMVDEDGELVIDLDDLDWVGVTVPWTDAHRARVDQVLALDEVGDRA